MLDVHLAVGILVLATNLVAGRLGRGRLASHGAQVGFWYALRVAQVVGRPPGRARLDPPALGPRGARRPPLPLRRPAAGRLAAGRGARAPGPPSASSRASTSTRCRASASRRSRSRSSAARPGSWPSRRWWSGLALRAARHQRIRAAHDRSALGRAGGSRRRWKSSGSAPACRQRGRPSPTTIDVVAAVVHLAQIAARAQTRAPSIIGRAGPLATRRPRPTSRMRLLGAEPPGERRLVGREHVDRRSAAPCSTAPRVREPRSRRRASAAARATARRRRWRSPRPGRRRPRAVTTVTAGGHARHRAAEGFRVGERHQ